MNESSDVLSNVQHEMSDSSVMSITPLVSVNMITYNHGAYLAEAIEGVVAQKTDFPIELIIGEDCSTDNTREIALDYQRRYPHLIRVIYSDKNVGMQKNGARTQARARGKYIATCEGDDYWTDNYKIAKQVDFLEKNRNYSACSHHCFIVDGNNKKISKTNFISTPSILYIEDILKEKKQETRTCSLVYRKEFLPYPWPEWALKVYAVDNLIRVFMAEKGPIYVMKDYMACYRRHHGGVWSSLKGKQIYQYKLNDLNILKQYLNNRFDSILRFRTDKLNYLFSRYIENNNVEKLKAVIKIFRYPNYVVAHPIQVIARLLFIIINIIK